MDFKIHSIDSDFFRVYYTTKNDHGEKLLYCLQYDGERCGGVKLYRCTKDGEPSHTTPFKKGIFAKDLMEVPVGESRIEILVRTWMENN